MTAPIEFGLLAMYAEDMYVDGALLPTAEPRIAAAGWDIVAYLTAQDVLIPDSDAPTQRLGVDPTKRVFYGFLARDKANPASFVAVVRGTEGIIEWLIDAEFLLIPHPRHAGVQVEQGFWNIYQTMSLADAATGVTTFQNAAEGIAKTVGAGSVTVTGHSLGSALATYLTDDLAERLGPRASACLFASPRTGDAAWTALFASTVTNYQLYNYILPCAGARLCDADQCDRHSACDGAGRHSPRYLLQPPCDLLLRHDRLCRHAAVHDLAARCELRGVHIAAADVR
jgi:hypothetical protein